MAMTTMANPIATRDTPVFLRLSFLPLDSLILLAMTITVVDE